MKRAKFASHIRPRTLTFLFWGLSSQKCYLRSLMFKDFSRRFLHSFRSLLFFVKTRFWTFSPLEWKLWQPKNLKIIGLTKEFLLILAIFGKTWKKESKFRKLWKNVFRICIPNYGLRMKIFNFISYYCTFFVLFFNFSCV